MTHSNTARALAPALLVPLLVAGLTLAGCGSSSTPLNFDSGVGGPVTGPVDMHCVGVDPIVTTQDSCHPPPDAGAGEPEPVPPILSNSEADDDDCKYHVKFMLTAAQAGKPTTFQVKVTRLDNGMPATGAGVDIEAVLNDTHPLPVTPNTSETPAGSGIYTIAPVTFDMSGQWVVRFHIFEMCSDLLEDSPHGHAAFYINVVP